MVLSHHAQRIGLSFEVRYYLVRDTVDFSKIIFRGLQSGERSPGMVTPSAYVLEVQPVVQAFGHRHYRSVYVTKTFWAEHVERYNETYWTLS